MSDDLVKPTPEQVADALESWCPCKATDDICQQHIACSHQAHGARVIREQNYRIEQLEAKLAKKDGNLEETYRRWKNGVDLRVLAKAEGCTQERMRHKMKRYEEDKARLLESKLAKAVEALEWCATADHNIMARFALAELKGKTDDLPSPELKNGPEG